MNRQIQTDNITHHVTNKISLDQTFIEISTSAILHNSAYYKNHIEHRNKLAVVIKGNGYGHGIENIARICNQDSNTDWLCVANLSEALIISSITTKPILVLGYTDKNPELALNKNIAFMLDNLTFAQKLNDLGKKNSYQFNVHLKIDTGLSRAGIFPHQIPLFLQQLKTMPYIKIDGIFSHFVASDNNPDLTAEQFNGFVAALENIPDKIIIPHIHMSNTHSTTNLNYSNIFSFFRVGLGIYGYGNAAQFLQPALTWKTHIVSIKTVPAHSYVGYACTYKTNRPTRIAILPVGYSDGYPLRFANKTSVLINNTLAPVIGRVAMNMTIVDVTDYSAEIDDEVILIGSAHNVQATDLAKKADMCNVRELLTGISPTIVKIVVP